MIALRAAIPTLTFVDEYFAAYANLFPEVRTFEKFKYLHLVMISELKFKSLPAITKAVGLHDSQPLQNFMTDSPWSFTFIEKAAISSAPGNVKRAVVQAGH